MGLNRVLFDTWLPMVVPLGALAILIIVLSIASSLIQQWYADHREAKKRHSSHEVPKDESISIAIPSPVPLKQRLIPLSQVARYVV
jgi:hypothetical protein